MTVQAISTLTYSEPSLYEARRPDEMGKTEFLSLLTAQLQHQDPLNPQDPAEFTSQLTEFSSLEQMITLNDNIETLQMLQLSSNNTTAASLIGRDVLYEGDELEIAGSQAEPIQFYSGTDAESLTITIYDENNQVVRTITGVSAESGINSIAWNGLDGESDTSAQLADGKYTFKVSGVDAQGNVLSFTPLTQGHVGGVFFEDGSTYLNVDGNKVRLSEVFSVKEVTTVTAAAAATAAVAAAQAGSAKDDSPLSLSNVAKILAKAAIKVSPLFL